MSGVSGVYFLCKDDDVVYVGKSVDVAARVRSHRSDKQFDRAFAVPVEEDRLDEVELAYINALQPPLNVIGKGNDPGIRQLDAAAMASVVQASTVIQAIGKLVSKWRDDERVLREYGATTQADVIKYASVNIHNVIQRLVGNENARLLYDRERERASIVQSAPPSWRERLWTAPAETRIGKAELLEAVGKTESWLYRHTAEKRKPGTPRIPHRKLDGELVFVVGEIRAWLRQHEEIVEAGPMESSPAERYMRN